VIRIMLRVTDTDDHQATPKVRLELVAGVCSGGECPTIYMSDRGTLVLQGYIFDPAAAGAEIPAGEQMIEVPVELLADYVRRIN
jgi:hypothetical protein